MKKNVLKAGIYGGAILILLILVFFIFRNTILRSIADEKAGSLRKRGIVVTYDELRFSGFSTLIVNGFSVRQEKMPPVMKWDSMKVSVSLLRLLTGSIKINEIHAGNIHFLLIRNEGVCNYHFLASGDTLQDDEDTLYVTTSFRKLISSLISRLQDMSPDEVKIKSVYIGSFSSSRYSSVMIPGLTFCNDIFAFDLLRSCGDRLARMKVTGKTESSENRISAEATCDNFFSFPFVDVKYDLHSGFDTASFSIRYKEEDDFISFSGYGVLKGMFVRNDRIAPDTVKFPSLYCNAVINAGDRWLEMDSSSVFVMNHLQFTAYLRYGIDTTRKVTLSIKTGETESDYLFSSLPEGLFTTLKGISTSGKLSFSLFFDADLTFPDSLKLDADLNKKDFRIVKFGNVNYSYINEPFTHTVYEKYGVVRSFEVGPSNFFYTPYTQVSRHLVNAILCTEDGAFFNHRGFIPEAFRESVATNIKEKRFARGGSTITMQLVKNVFLNRNKNIARKAEEMLIVWMIENMGLVSKERMMEVYLNIIEWGPGLYGAGEACDFYFGKKPAALSVEEAIYLASIIPMPKYYKSRFQHDGNLKPDALNYIRLIRNKMVSKGMITPADTLIQSLNFRPEFIKSHIVLSDSVQSPEVSN
jgi:hypothetical protein